MSTQTYPILTFADAATGTAFLEAVGFRRVALHHEDEAGLVVAHGEYAWGPRGGVMIGSADRSSPFADRDQVGRGRVYCVVDRDAQVDEVHAAAVAAGGTSLDEPHDEDYGGRVCSVRDPEGNELSFGSYAGTHGAATLRPKLVVADAGAAIGFYAAAFDARVDARHEQAGAIVLAQLTLGDLGIDVQLKDADEADPLPAGSPGVVLELCVADPDAVAARALAAGASERFPVADMSYGARQGRVVDPFGHQWLVTGPLTMSPAEVDAALADG